MKLNKQKGNSLLLTFSILILFIVLVPVFYFYVDQDEKSNKNYFSKESGFKYMHKTDLETDISFKCPKDLKTKYIFTQKWPPDIELIRGDQGYEWVSMKKNEIKCARKSSKEDLVKIIQKTIAGHKYCVKETSEGAAGSIYKSYAYSTVVNERLIILEFALQYPQCQNYNKAQRSECEKEVADFSIEPVVEDIVKSISFNNRSFQLRKALERYLLSQREFSWQTSKEGERVCIFEKLDKDNKLFPYYIWVRCGEFILENGKLKELSGASLPAKIEYPNELSYFNLEKFEHKIPRDGSLYVKDVERIFPGDLSEKVFNFNKAGINKKIEEVAEERLK